MMGDMLYDALLRATVYRINSIISYNRAFYKAILIAGVRVGRKHAAQSSDNLSVTDPDTWQHAKFVKTWALLRLVEIAPTPHVFVVA